MLRSARRLLRHKDRLAAGAFLAEGGQAVSEALADAGVVQRVLVSEAAVDAHRDLLQVAVDASIPIATVAPRPFAALTDTVTPQGILAVCRPIDVGLADVFAAGVRLVVLCDRVRDPGNLGTVIRCADAFGADGVLVSADSVDLYNPKTVRASTGSIFHLPIAVGVDLATAATAARIAGLAVLGADGAAPVTVDDLALSGELTGPVMWVLGNEAWGLTAEHAALLDRLVALPIYGRAESLNLSTAAAVLLYATAIAQRAPSTNHTPRGIEPARSRSGSTPRGLERARGRSDADKDGLGTAGSS